MAPRRISIIGTGYVGLVTGICFAELGNNVFFVDISEQRIEDIKNGKMPIYEKGLEELFRKNRKKISATTDIKEAAESTDISFICVGTPSGKNGEINLEYIRKAAEDIGNAIKGKQDHMVIVKSTVVPGTTENVVAKTIKETAGNRFRIGMNPEFLREGNAVHDFLNPDRVVIGTKDEKVWKELEALYEPVNAPILRTDIKTAEMIKYASNALLATKISFINELGNLCKKAGIDTYRVAEGMGLDKRIGRHFLNSGIGYGGSCFPKDVLALIRFSQDSGTDLEIIKKVHEVNEKQPLKILDVLREKTDPSGKTIAVLGLAFKPDTDDVRESPAIKIVKELMKYTKNIRAYDPKGMENFRKIFPELIYCKSAREAVSEADACLLLTEWEEFKNLTEYDFSGMKSKIIIEGRKILSRERVKDFEGVCW